MSDNSAAKSHLVCICCTHHQQSDWRFHNQMMYPPFQNFKHYPPWLTSTSPSSLPSSPQERWLADDRLHSSLTLLSSSTLTAAFPPASAWMNVNPIVPMWNERFTLHLSSLHLSLRLSGSSTPCPLETPKQLVGSLRVPLASSFLRLLFVELESWTKVGI